LFGKKSRSSGTNERKFIFRRPDMDRFWDMITYDKLSRNPQVANNLIGMPLADFDKLYAEFELFHTTHANALQNTRRYKAKRRRAAGGGRKHKYPLRERLLMTLFWLRAYTTLKVLGFLYELHKSSVEDSLNDVLDTLERMTTFHFERPQAEIPKLRSVQEVMSAFPELRMMIDVPR
jgi:hypothetical protein